VGLVLLGDMAPSAPRTKIVRFGLFAADLELRLLNKEGARVKLQDQPFQVLALLLERPHEIVTREEIQQKLWAADTYVAFDDGLNTAIKKLRLALGDSADNPRFIETVPRRGYRFLAAPRFEESTGQIEVPAAGSEGASAGVVVQVANPVVPDPVQEPIEVVRELQEAAAASRSRALRLAGFVVAIAVLAASGTIWWKSSAGRKSSTFGAASASIEPQPSARGTRRMDPRAHEEYLLARSFWKQRTAEALTHAVEHFNLAIEHDPNYAEAYAGLANCYVVMPMLSTLPTDDSYLKARQAAEKALALNDSVAEGHLAAAELKLYSDRNFTGAETEFRRALELDSNDAQAHQWYAEFLSLMGRHQEALAEIHMAQHLDPLSMIIHHQAGQVYQNARMYPEALLEYRKTLMIQPGFGPTYAAMMLAFRRQGRYQESVEAQRQANRYWDPGETSSEDLKRLADASVRGKQAYLRAALEFNKKHPSTAYNAAFDYALLDENEKALQWLQTSLAAREPQIINLLNDPEFDRLKANPRVQEIARKVGLKPVSVGAESWSPLAQRFSAAVTGLISADGFTGGGRTRCSFDFGWRAGPPFPSFQLRRVPRPCRVFCDRAGILTYPGTTAVDFTYDNDSRLTQVTDPTGAYQFTFDSMGRLTGTTTQYAFLNSRTFTNSYSYDAVSNGRSVSVLFIVPKAMTQEKAPYPGLGLVKLDFLIGTKWGSKAGREPELGGRMSLSERRIKTLPLSHYSSKTWR
jgi:YD repeat-containing protein